ncbi:neural Wiskott-Aldrich syndrome protein-like [Schistocerca nitens]|uniref:neural Wiskott-Aldrich syndrome protein-like n=1 Tax=Schistocerca nitens TaxID=7011 RepID=UPI002118CD39|nr:neural Wiskott-Aldrich syndrome protein-like [Schistocerca nitens]
MSLSVLHRPELKASRLPPSQPTTPQTAPPPPAPPRAHLPSPPPQSGHLHQTGAYRRRRKRWTLRPPPPSPMKVASPPPHPSLPSGGARSGQVSMGRFPRTLASNSGSRVDSAHPQFRCPPPQLRRPWVPPPAVGSHTRRRRMVNSVRD